MATWPLVELSGLIDPNVFTTGYYPTGPDVGAEVTQVLSKVNECVVGANELKTDLDAEEAAGAFRDTRLSAHDTSISANQDNITQNQVDILALETADTAQDALIATNTSNIATNAADIDTLEAAVGLGMLAISGDIADFDFTTYGDYSQFVLKSSSQKDTITLPFTDGVGATQWKRGTVIRFICRSSYGATITSTRFIGAPSNDEVHLGLGDVVDCIVAYDNTDIYWSVSLVEAATRTRNFKVLSATESYSLPASFHFHNFSVSGQSSGNVAEVTLPAITDDIVGMELKGFHHGADGDLRFTCSGTDQILKSTGSTGSSIDLTDSPGTAVGTLTALPAVSGVYYWGASFDG